MSYKTVGILNLTFRKITSKLNCNFNNRSFHCSFPVSKHVQMVFQDRFGKHHQVKARIGDSLLDVIRDNDLEFESFGACDGVLACSTCHVIMPEELFDESEELDMEEEDMLDLACGLEDTSRLGCQVDVSEDMEGHVIKLPSEIVDARLL